MADKLRVYVAGAWVEQMDRARPTIARLRETGLIEITHDWTVSEILPLSDSDLSPEERVRHAQADLDGVLAAQVLLLLAANDKSACGSWVELGAALAVRAERQRWVGYPTTRPCVVVAGVKNRRTIFTELADHLCETDAEAERLVVERAWRHQRPVEAP